MLKSSKITKKCHPSKPKRKKKIFQLGRIIVDTSAEAYLEMQPSVKLIQKPWTFHLLDSRHTYLMIVKWLSESDLNTLQMNSLERAGSRNINIDLSNECHCLFERYGKILEFKNIRKMKIHIQNFCSIDFHSRTTHQWLHVTCFTNHVRTHNLKFSPNLIGPC